jgi:bisanhydrobacterioruberin hydratase
MKHKTYLQALILIFYAVGTVGILHPETRALFLTLTVYNLILSFLIIVFARDQDKKSFYKFLANCWIVGFVLEWLGVHTSLLFGDYSYGENLGIKFLDIPFVIGLNWGIVTVSSAAIAHRISKNKKWVPVLAAFLMVLLDFFMEPMAMKSDFWSWKNNIIPIYNYICWAIVGWLLQFIYQKMNLWEENKVNDTLFITMLVFFIILKIGL